MVTYSIRLELALNTPIRRRIWEIGEQRGAILYGDFTLASGEKSSYYFDGKKITLWPESAYLIGKEILELLRDIEVDAIGGLAVGADPIATAVAVVSHLEGRPIPAFIVRSERKQHGTKEQIQGHLPARGGKVVVVDDVITKGGSVFEAIRVVEAAGCRVVRVIAILDRHQGGSDKLRSMGYDFQALYEANYEPAAPGKVKVTIA